MRLRRGETALVLAALAVAIAAPAHADDSIVRCGSPGDSRIELSVAAADRTAVLHVPPGPPRPAPLLIALHGYGRSGPQMERYSGLSRVADRQRFIVAYPNAAGLSWTGRDLAFLSALIGALERRGCVDPTRVSVVGVSNGGGMAAQAGCGLSRELSAVVAVAGDYDGLPRCRPARAVSLLEIHGTADRVAPYRGVPAFVAGWARRDGCAAVPSSDRYAPRTTSYTWTACREGTAVERIVIAGGAHQWPGGRPPDPGPPATICASCAIWRFLASAVVRPARRSSDVRSSSWRIESRRLRCR